jgi:polyisoprenoid-binding protein YceI
MTFNSTKVELTGANRGRLHGDLTIRDVARKVVLDVEYTGIVKSPFGSTSAGFSGTTTINRKDWGLNWNVALEAGGFLVSDQINIEIELELVKVAEEIAQPA